MTTLLWKKAVKLVNKRDIPNIRNLLYEDPSFVNFQDPNGDSLLHYGARQGDLAMIKLLVEEFKSQVSTENKFARSPIYEAMQSHECVSFLLDHGVDPNQFKHGTWTPLMYASLKNCNKSAKLLLSHGANPDIQNKDDLSALHLACRDAELDMVDLLLEASPSLVHLRSRAGRLPMHIACARGSYDIAIALIDAAPDTIDAIDAGGSTPLHEACGSGNEELVRELIHRGASILAQDMNGRTPAHVAAIQGHGGVLKVLLSGGDNNSADPSAVRVKDNNGWTPLFCAVQNGHREAVEVLLESGVDTMGVVDKQDRSVMDLAIMWKRDELVELLTRRRDPPVVCTAAEAVAHIPSYTRIYVHSVAACPGTLLSALAERHNELHNVEFIHLHIDKPNPCSNPLWEEAFFTNNFFVGANQRKAVEEGYSSYIPVFLSEVPHLMRRNIVRPDWALLNLSAPDKHGYCSMGVEVCAALPAAQTATKIIGQINKNMPRTHGQSFIHVNALDYIVENVDEPLPEAIVKPPTKVEQQIGKHIAGLVEDGACLQMGIGGIPNAVLGELGSHKDLGIHTEMFMDGIIPLVEKGVITNNKKHFYPGKIVTSFVMGTRKLYDFVDDNPSIAFMDASVTNNPVTIGSNDKVTAINSAIEVDLTGQVCADSVGTRHISGVGGQVDFERGAAISRRGLPIICLPSTTKTGESRIVSMLRPGSGVTTTRTHVHYVVTEYGVAYLVGKNLHERAKALIDVSHPAHRFTLEREAFERYNLKTWI
ncbi:hypothetical protein SmJEL517_g03940 [Synchytrium microbalum]|uniref:Uncharacterized protein n=1 Tax=Synchytrium microbalum TaxID=1806994 RepID=A0A507C6B7_9FUNG|nr:uncharacterized protein SmJEL517_g03940 [Synchytrium microbalum]TPX33093.1 hypothetical protein SmJEL517_g03940 [Synchytrium microbalum]